MPLSKFLPHDQFQQVLFSCFLLLLVVSCIHPPYPNYLLMQHVLTLLAAWLLAYMANRFDISRFSFVSIIVFLALHTIGARYLYSYTPYDAWSEKLFGIGINETLGFERNHYDRLVHFSFGLLMAVPIQEFERHYLRLSPNVATVLAIECILATSAAYELLEWLIAVVFTPDWADKFLGQQGDIFDAQKDTALATLGAMISIVVNGLMKRRKSNMINEASH